VGTFSGVGICEYDLFTFKADPIPDADPTFSLRGLALFKANVLSGKTGGQVGRGITVATDETAQIGAAYYASGTCYYSVFDASGVNPAGVSFAAVRLGPNMPIDFSAVQGTASSINTRNLLYNSASGKLEYHKSSTSVFAISDYGDLSVAGTINIDSAGTLVGQLVPNGIVFLNYTGSSTVGLDFAGAAISQNVLRLTAGQNVNWDGSNAVNTSYSSGYWQVTNLGTTQFAASILGGNSYFSGSVGVGGAAGPYWSSGIGSPAYIAPRGSMFSRTDGAVGSTLYVSQGGGTWHTVAGV
jgi:hypothetical protein